MKSYKEMETSHQEMDKELYDAIKESSGGKGDYYTKAEIDEKFDETRESIQKSVTSGEIRTDDDGVYLILD